VCTCSKGSHLGSACRRCGPIKQSLLSPVTAADATPPAPAPPLLDWETVHAKMQWGVIMLLGGGFAIADAVKVSLASMRCGTVRCRAARQRNTSHPAWMHLYCFYRATLCYSGLMLSSSVCVLVSDTRRYCIKTAKLNITQTTPYDSTGNLVFWCQRPWRNSNWVTSNGVGCQIQVVSVKIGDFRQITGYN